MHDLQYMAAAKYDDMMREADTMRACLWARKKRSGTTKSAAEIVKLVADLERELTDPSQRRRLQKIKQLASHGA